MTRIVAISDTHSYHRKVIIPPADILIHAGDISWQGERSIIKDYCEWGSELIKKGVIKEVITVAGNHDLSLQDNRSRDILEMFNCYGITYLEDEEYITMGLKIWGSPWSNEFGNWAFMTNEHELDQIYNKIPDDTDIIISHGPSYDVLDMTARGVKAGSRALSKHTERVCPKLLITGHLHEAYGTHEDKEAGTFYANASICTLQYAPINKPIVINVP